MPTYSIFDCDMDNPTAIGGEASVALNVEADVIVTSMILGFICSRYYQRQSCQFDFEHPNIKESDLFADLDTKTKEELSKKISERAKVVGWDNISIDEFFYWLSDGVEDELSPKYTKYLQEMQDFYLTLDALSEVVDKQESGMGKWLKDGQSPFGKEGELITGKKGGEMLSPKSRATELTLSKAAMLENALNKKDTVYRGRGAYTGLVENPIRSNEYLYPTMRVMPNNIVRRWNGIDNVQNWGLIRSTYPNDSANIANLNTDPSIGMGPLPGDSGNAKVGYMHGMCTAITHCVDEGTWCTPYEMATGDKTTKMASCFPCSTFMYASGYPPTSIHLGRGESWLPPQPGNRLELVNVEGPLDGNKKVTGCSVALSANLSAKWHLEIHQQMQLGLQCLKNVEEFVSADHYGKLAAFEARLTRDVQANDLAQNGGGLFLDALTMHDKEEARVRRTLAPVYKTLEFMASIILG